MSTIQLGKLSLSIFGESHGPAVGAVLDGFPAGIRLDEEKLLRQMARRAPGQDKSATPRRESDLPRILSGVKEGITTGAPICAVVENANTRSGDYSPIPRPSHADYAAHVKYGGYNDIAGGGHFSGRLTAPFVFAGALCRQLLEPEGIFVGGHVLQIGSVQDEAFDPCRISADSLRALSGEYFAVLSQTAREKMKAEIEDARLAGDSVGGTVEVAAAGLPAGWGDPMFDGVENLISRLLFAVPAVKGVEFGEGFGFAALRGSDANDCLCVENGKICTETNRCGGITGGITNGMPLLFRAAFKPTPSIGKEQRSVDLKTGKPVAFRVKGRHDPCIVPRGLPGAEAAAAIALAELMLREGRKR